MPMIPADVELPWWAAPVAALESTEPASKLDAAYRRLAEAEERDRLFQARREAIRNG